MSALHVEPTPDTPLPLWLLPADEPRGSRAAVLAAYGLTAVWLVGASAAAVASGHLAAGLLLIATIMAGELSASRDDFGSKALSGTLAFLAVLLVGWPGGVVIALGAVAFGDLLLRGQPLGRAL